MMSSWPQNTVLECKHVAKEILDSYKPLTLKPARERLKKLFVDLEAAIKQGSLPDVGKHAAAIKEILKQHQHTITVKSDSTAWLFKMETIEGKDREKGEDGATGQQSSPAASSFAQAGRTSQQSQNKTTSQGSVSYQRDAQNPNQPVGPVNSQPDKSREPFVSTVNVPNPGSQQHAPNLSQTYGGQSAGPKSDSIQYEQRIAYLTMEKEKLQVDNTTKCDQISGLEESERCYKSQVKELHEMLDRLRGQLSDKGKEIDALNRVKQDYEETLKCLQQENESNTNAYRTKYSALKQAYEDEVKNGRRLAAEMAKEIRDREEKISSLKDEKNDLSSRYSQLASERLKQNNPDIVDLSDPNRAMKLADRYNGIYNDIWTDTCEELQSLQMSNQSAIVYLLQGLLESFNYCEEIAKCQLTSLNSVLLHPIQSTSKPVNQVGASWTAINVPMLKIHMRIEPL